jgi:glycosyltransferase involved in cell wall biosynthesis
MQKSVIFWTGLYSPQHEAISKEIKLLRDHTGGMVYAISSQDFLRFSFRQKYLVHFYRPYRLAPALVSRFESRYDISHIFHNFNNPFFLTRLGRKPVILTGAAGGEIPEPDNYRHVDYIVAESRHDYQRLLDKGHDPAKLRLIYPGIVAAGDDAGARPVDADGDRFTVLFASSPFSLEYFEARGIPLLLAAAEALPDVRFVLLWRDWPETTAEIRRRLAAGNNGRGYANVELVVENVDDMNAYYRRAHCVTTPFTSDDLCKPCPNSIPEGMAMGRPGLVSDKVGISDVIRETDSGIVFKPDRQGFVDAISRLIREYDKFRANCRPAAMKYFSTQSFLGAYQALYDSL